jgi:hypothetical protein
VKRKLTPEERERYRRLDEESKKADVALRAAIERADAYLAARREQREARALRRARLLRLLPFRRAA